MSLKSFRYVIEQAQAWASGYGPGYAEFVITTTDGQVPTSSSIFSGQRVFSNTAPAGTHNIDFSNSYVVHINGSPRNDNEKTTRGIKHFEFSDGQLENAADVNPEVLRFSETCKLYFTLTNNDWLLFDPFNNALKYNSSLYGSNPSSGVTIGAVKKLFRSESGMQSYINENLLDYEVKLQTLNANMIATTSDKSIYYGNNFGYDAVNSTVLYSQFSTPHAGVTFDEIGYALAASANASALSGSVTVQVHAVDMSTLKSNSSRTPEAQVQIPLSQLSTLRTTAMAKFIFGKLQSAVTLSGNTVHTVKATFSNVGASYTNGLRAGLVTGLNQYIQSGSYGTDPATSNASFPFMLTTEIVPPPSNTLPTDILLSTYTIAENAGVNAVVGTFSAVDAEGGAMTYSLVAGTGDTHNSLFNISGSGLRANASFDYENMPAGAIGKTLSVRVQATDSGNLSYSKALTITVSNADETPTDIMLSSASIQEGNAINAVIGTLSGVDVDGMPLTFSIVSGGDKFNVSGNNLRASVAFDYETAQSHSVTIRATDSSALSFEKAFIINVLNQTSDDPVTIQSPVVLGGKAVAVVATDPRVAPLRVTIAGVEQALPTGSVVKLSSTGQKFLKVSGDELAFTAISVTPDAEWSWAADGMEAWSILQSL